MTDSDNKNTCGNESIKMYRWNLHHIKYIDHIGLSQWCTLLNIVSDAIKGKKNKIMYNEK